MASHAPLLSSLSVRRWRKELQPPALGQVPLVGREVRVPGLGPAHVVGNGREDDAEEEGLLQDGPGGGTAGADLGSIVMSRLGGSLVVLGLAVETGRPFGMAIFYK